MKGYQRHIGSTTYPASTTRPDIAFSVSRLAKFLQNPLLTYLAEINRLLTYLYNIRFLTLKFSIIMPYKINQVLKAIFNASFTNNTLTYQSLQGFLISLFNGPIVWQATRQKAVTKSTMEAELLALSYVSGEVKHIVQIFKAIRFNLEQDVIINCNNQQSVWIVIKETPIVSTKL